MKPTNFNKDYRSLNLDLNNEELKIKKSKNLEDYPLSFQEQQMYILNSLLEDKKAYNVHIAFDLIGDLNVKKLYESVKKIVDKHDAFRCLFIKKDGKLKKIVNKSLKVEIETVKCLEVDFDSEVEKHNIVFDLNNGPIFKFVLFEFSKNHHVLYLNMHHIAVDGMSLSIIAEDFWNFYNDKATEDDEIISSIDYSCWQNETLNDKALNPQKEYWNNIYKDNIPQGNLPLSFSRPKVLPSADCIESTLINKEMFKSITTFARKNNVTSFDIMVLAATIMVSLYSQSEELVFGVPFGGRIFPELKDTVGMFVNTLPLKFCPSSNKTVLEYLNEIKTTKENTVKNQLYSIEKIVSDLNIFRDSSRNALYDVLFNYLHEIPEYKNDKLILKRRKIKKDSPAIDLAIEVVKEKSNFEIEISYSKLMFNRKIILSMLRQYKKILKDIITSENPFIKDLMDVSDYDLKMLNKFNETQKSYKDMTVIEAFKQQVNTRPNDIALVYKEKKYTYLQLDKITDILAKNLINNGITSEKTVGVLVKRNEYMVICSLGVLKAKGAYVPLDYTYPSDRLEFMLKDTNTNLLIADDDILNIVNNYEGKIIKTSEIFNMNDMDINLQLPKLEDLFVILYTSGSTGKPKGCMLEHKNIINVCNDYKDKLNLTYKEKVAAYASYGFDASIIDVYPILTVGGCVHIIPEEMRLNLFEINDYFEKNNITVSFLTTQIAMQFAMNFNNTSLKYLLAGGEKLSYFKKNNYSLINIYGPSECTVFITSMLVDKPYDVIPVGRPTYNTKIYIVSKDNKLCPVGVEGELCVAGKQVSRGYLNRPEMNDEKFVKNPFSNEPGYEKMYKTGDICKWLQDGNIEVVGRKDGQVKVRGFRIELTEIENRILENDKIKDVAVIGREKQNGEKYVCAYIVSDSVVDTNEIKSFINETLPKYMVPEVIMQIDKIPLNQNHKVDVKRLPLKSTEARKTVGAKNKTQKAILEILSKFIDTKDFGVDDDIFEFGLNSIGIIKVSIELEKEFNKSISAQDIIKNSTVLKLEAKIQSKEDQNKDYSKYDKEKRDLSKWLPNEKNANKIKKYSKSINSDMQKKIFDILTNFIDTENLEADSSIFENGLNSLGMVKLSIALSKEFNKNISAQDIIKNDTILKLEAKIQSSKKNKVVYSKEKTYPLTETELGIYIECVKDIESTVYNIPHVVKLGSINSVDINKLKESILKAIDAHSYMKCYFSQDNFEIVKVRNDSFKYDIEVIETTEERFNCLKEKIVKPFNLYEGPLFRIKIYKTQKTVYLFMDIHHIICDGTSISIFMNDVFKAYSGIKPEKEKYTSFELSLDESARRKSEEYTKAKEYFNSIFKDLQIDSCISKDKDDNDDTSAIVKLFDKGISVSKVEKLCKDYNITPNVLFMGAFAFILSKYNNSDEVSFCTIYNGRTDVKESNIMGMLVKTFPLYINTAKSNEIKAFLSSLKKNILDTISNDIYSLREISEEYNIKSDILFSYQGGEFTKFKFNSKYVELEPLTLNKAKANMLLSVDIIDGEYVFYVEYKKGLYYENTMSRLLNSYIESVKGFIKEDEISNISILSNNSLEIINRSNNTTQDIENLIIPKIFEDQVRFNPNKIAVISCGKSYTYKELNENANRLANSLIKLGIKKEDLVGMMLKRDCNLSVVRQGILKSGGAFLPIDPDYPIDRIKYIINDSKTKYIITTNELKEQYDNLFKEENVKIFVIDDLLNNSNKSNPNVDIKPNNLCYCIYTSGSTGKPKGVLIEHRNLANYCNNKNLEVRIFKDSSAVLSLANIVFDVSILEEFIPHLNGLTLVIANEDEIYNPLQLSKLILKNNVDAITCTPSFISNIIDLNEVKSALEKIKVYDIGAEAFPGKLYNKIKSLNKDARVFNGYGPTETTIGASLEEILESENITIGKPLLNTKMYVLDKFNNVLPIGIVGELAIAGMGVGRGYANNKKLTKEKYIKLNNERAYKTGDLVKWNTEGKLEFIGRIDNQVKLRGFRIELEEIENVLNSFEDITSSAVVIKQNNNEQLLVAFFSAEKKVDINRLKEYISTKLTNYMIPEVFMQLDNLPLTVNGKIDKKYLLKKDIKFSREFIKPKTKEEIDICDIFSKITKKEKVGVTDKFFEIGGTSLSAIKVVSKAISKGYNFTYSDLFKYQSPRELCNYLKMNSSVKDVIKDEETSLYDYAAINNIIKKNSIENIKELELSNYPGDVLLTGAVGFLGIHILKEFIDFYPSKIYCFARKGKFNSLEERLKDALKHYFGYSYSELLGSKIICIEGDITDLDFVMKLKDYYISTIINCAANVKHYEIDNEIEKVNVEGVENLIKLCKENNTKLIQISTSSVAGESVNGKPDPLTILKESDLYVNQVLDNKYIRAKFLSERMVLEEVAKGLNAKIMRVGSLMPRSFDGKFQINYATNAFMNMLKGYKIIGKFPKSQVKSIVELSPVDCAAKAVLKLSCVNDEYTVFHPYNNKSIPIVDIIYAMNEYGFNIDIVDDVDFEFDLYSKIKDENKHLFLTDILSIVESKDRTLLDTDNLFTTKILSNLNFTWPSTKNEYIIKFIESLDKLKFFELED